MAIAVMPIGPEDRWERLGYAALKVAAAIVLVLLAYSMLDAYVF